MFSTYFSLDLFICEVPSNGCFLKFGGVELSIVNAPPDYNSDQLFKSNLIVGVFNLEFVSVFKTSGSFTIDSPTPTLTAN
jgi:hypothetical protein